MTSWREPDSIDRGSFEPEAVFEAGLLNHHVSSTAYPIAHDSSWRPYRVPREEMEGATARAFRSISELGLYAHIPFCETRCSFCEYTVTRRSEHSSVALYMDAILRELELYEEAIDLRSKTLAGFDIGGGTPSFVPAGEIDRLVRAVRGRLAFREGADISIETTPKIAAAEPSKLRAYRESGIERISMGIQVIEPDLLKVLNREANGIETHRAAVDNLRDAGFRRLNLDLMYGFKDQSLESLAGRGAPCHRSRPGVHHSLPDALQAHPHLPPGARRNPRARSADGEACEGDAPRRRLLRDSRENDLQPRSRRRRHELLSRETGDRRASLPGARSRRADLYRTPPSPTTTGQRRRRLRPTSEASAPGGFPFRTSTTFPPSR